MRMELAELQKRAVLTRNAICSTYRRVGREETRSDSENDINWGNRDRGWPRLSSGVKGARSILCL